jgi:hypothetical protein
MPPKVGLYCTLLNQMTVKLKSNSRQLVRIPPCGRASRICISRIRTQCMENRQRDQTHKIKSRLTAQKVVSIEQMRKLSFSNITLARYIDFWFPTNMILFADCQTNRKPKFITFKHRVTNK